MRRSLTSSSSNNNIHNSYSNNCRSSQCNSSYMSSTCRGHASCRWLGRNTTVRYLPKP